MEVLIASDGDKNRGTFSLQFCKSDYGSAILLCHF